MVKTKEDIVAEIVGKGAAHAAEHFAFGGELGSALSTITGGASSLAGGVQSVGQALTPQDTYQATAPSINQTNFGPLNAQAVQNVAAGSNMQNNAYNTLQNNVLPGQEANAGSLAATGAGSIQAQQEGLAGTLADQAAGNGPNPAQDQFAQNVNNNTATTAGTIASEKGLSPGLAARLMAEQQSAGAQNAAGSAATLQAQQQISAQQQLAAQQQAIVATKAAAGSAYGQVGNSATAVGNLGTEQGNLGNAELSTDVNGNNAQNNTLVSATNGTNAINAATAAANTSANQKTTGGIENGLLGMGTSAMSPGAASPAAGETGSPLAGPPSSAMMPGGYNGGEADQIKPIPVTASHFANGGFGSLVGPAMELAPLLLNKGGNVKTPLVKQPAANVVAQANPTLAAHLMAQGGQVPGTPAIPHNDIKNDVVPAVLSKKEIVLPLNVTMAKDAPARAAAFVEHLKKTTQPGYHQVIAARAKKKA
jgi:hypothetical protein